ncbi:GAF domain-containing DNA-binding protein [Oleiharenicola lentus]|uniref:GAF domain-containing DNA-binding protein n=1 Tax=Oleiharenicola lentus TaxID=2508720 RepID=UPI003F6769F5
MTKTVPSLLFQIAQRLLSAPLADAPLEALRVIGPAFDADRAWLIFFDEAQENFWVAYEWCADGVPDFLPDFPGVPVALIAHPMKDFLKGRAVVLSDIERLPPDAQNLKEEMRREGNRATAGAPLLSNGRLVALIGLDDTRKRHAWSAAEMRALQQLGELVLAAAARARFVEAGSGPWRNAAQPAPPAQSGGCYLRAGNCHVQVRWEEIVAISAEGDHTRVQLRTGREFLELKALAVWEAMLPKGKFGRVHRSHIVGWAHVSRLRRVSGGRWTLELESGEEPLPVGRNYQVSVRKHINLRPV